MTYRILVPNQGSKPRSPALEIWSLYHWIDKEVPIGTLSWLSHRQFVVYLIYMQSTSYKMPGWMEHKLESILLGEISTTLDMLMIPC